MASQRADRADYPALPGPSELFTEAELAHIADAGVRVFLAAGLVLLGLFLANEQRALVEHDSAIKTGLAFLPFPIILGLMSSQMRKLIARHGHRRYLILGPSLIAVAMTWICFLPVHGNYALHVLPSLLLMPIGYGMSFAPVYAAATSGVPARQAGLASALITTSQQMGGAAGLAGLSGIAASFTASLTHDPAPAGPDVRLQPSHGRLRRLHPGGRPDRSGRHPEPRAAGRTAPTRR